MRPHPFRFGVVAGRPASGGAWRETARRAEGDGYATLVLPDTRFTPSPFPTLAAAAGATSALRVGTWVLAAPVRPAAAVVRETAALQLVSDGRFELGIGTGRPDAAAEAAAAGLPWGSAVERRRLLHEVVAAVRAEVRPVPPVLVAAGGARMLAEADSQLVALALPPTASLAEVRRAAEAARAGGRDPVVALQLSGVGGRPVAHLRRQGVDEEALSTAAGLLRGDAPAMAEALLRLRAETEVSYILVAEEQAADLAPVVGLLGGA